MIRDCFASAPEAFSLSSDTLVSFHEVHGESRQCYCPNTKLAGEYEHKAEETMVPVDMRGIGKEYDDVGTMIEELGAKGVCEAFGKARDYFEAHKEEMEEDERPAEITWEEWQMMQQGGLQEGFEEEFFEGGEEEEFDEGEEEPAAKKQKTN